MGAAERGEIAVPRSSMTPRPRWAVRYTLVSSLNVRVGSSLWGGGPVWCKRPPLELARWVCIVSGAGFLDQAMVYKLFSW
jgi:hypothetical protein